MKAHSQQFETCEMECCCERCVCRAMCCTVLHAMRHGVSFHIPSSHENFPKFSSSFSFYVRYSVTISFFSLLFRLVLLVPHFFKSSSLLLSLASCKTKARQKTKYWQASERRRERQKKLKSTNDCRIFHAVKRVY